MNTEFTEKFELAHAHVAKVEGDFVDHKNDPGGVTRHGISLRFLQDYANTTKGREVLNSLNIYTANREAIVRMTAHKAKVIYYNAFWTARKIDQLPQNLAIVIYDFAVNSGTYYAIRLLQKAINAQIDGVIGKESIVKSALATSSPEKEKQVLTFLLEERAKFYMRLANKNPKMEVFLKGWLNRVEILRTYLNQIRNKS